MALCAEESSGCYGGQNLTVTIHKMRDTDHRRLRLTNAPAAVATEALVSLQVDLIVPDVMRYGWWLLRVTADLANIRIDHFSHQRCLGVNVQGFPAQGRDGITGYRGQSQPQNENNDNGGSNKEFHGSRPLRL